MEQKSNVNSIKPSSIVELVGFMIFMQTINHGVPEKIHLS